MEWRRCCGIHSIGIRRFLAVTHPVASRACSRTPAALTAACAALLAALGAGSAALAQSALFEARDVAAERFVLVAAPIGNGERSQLNIYEQIKDTRLCFSTSGSSPAQVEPLLGGFDFTGICSRYIDGNGYSLRVGGEDLASIYRLSVIRQGGDTLLLAAPTKAGAGPEMVVARSGGQASGFLQLVFEPGWKLMRRHFGSRSLGHVYIYRDGWPGAAAGAEPAAPIAEPPVQKASPEPPPQSPSTEPPLQKPSPEPPVQAPAPSPAPAESPAPQAKQAKKAKQAPVMLTPATISPDQTPATSTAKASPRLHPLPPSRRF